MENEIEQTPVRPVSMPIPERLEESMMAFFVKQKARTEGIINRPGILRLLTNMNQIEELSRFGFDRHVAWLKELAKGTIKNGVAKNLAARLFGYKHYQDVTTAADLTGGRVKNLRHGQEADIPMVATVSLDRARSALDKKWAVSPRGIAAQHNLMKPGYKGIGMVQGRFVAKDMAMLVRDFGSQFRTAWLVGNRTELREIAVQRFFGLKQANDLAPYLKLRAFPPGFDPVRVVRSETKLSKHLGSEELRDRKWTAESAFLELLPWCATPEIAKELEVTISVLAGGRPRRYAQFLRRKYGVVCLVINHEAGVGLVTQSNKITKIFRLINKTGKAPRETQ